MSCILGIDFIRQVRAGQKIPAIQTLRELSINTQDPEAVVGLKAAKEFAEGVADELGTEIHGTMDSWVKAQLLKELSLMLANTGSWEDTQKIAQAGILIEGIKTS